MRGQVLMRFQKLNPTVWVNANVHNRPGDKLVHHLPVSAHRVGIVGWLPISIVRRARRHVDAGIGWQQRQGQLPGDLWKAFAQPV
jgi:hypothetical protein